MPIKNFIDQLFDGKEDPSSAPPKADGSGQAKKALQEAKNLVLKEKSKENISEKQEKPQEKSEISSEKETISKEKEVSTKLSPKPKTQVKPQPRLQKAQEILEIERIMEDDLEEAYQRMSPELKNKFKEKGEETATKISLLLQKARVKAKNILELLKDWLKMVPGINKFFLEQEAKIKTDKILKLKNKNDN